jgi:hypothetical protein
VSNSVTLELEPFDTGLSLKVDRRWRKRRGDERGAWKRCAGTLEAMIWQGLGYEWRLSRLVNEDADKWQFLDGGRVETLEEALSLANAALEVADAAQRLRGAP